MTTWVESEPGVRLAVTMEGPEDGEPVLLSHSLGCDADLWAPQVPVLARAYRVIRYDARGHGRSSSPNGDYTVDQLGRDALAVLDAAGAARAHIVGLSMGGMIAMWLGAHAPQRVRALVLAHTGARLGTLDRWTQRIELARTKGMAELADLVMPMWFSPGFREREPNIVERFRRQLAASSPVGYAGCCAALRDADLRDAVAGIRARTLVIAGLQDQATPMSHAELLCERIAGAELAQIDAAHIGNVEQPESFSEAVVGFLASG